LSSTPGRPILEHRGTLPLHSTLTARLLFPGVGSLSQPSRIGVFPILRHCERRRAGEAGKEEEVRRRGSQRRDAASAPRPEAARVNGGRLYCLPRRRGAWAEQGMERRRECLHRAAFFVKPAMTPSLTQREMNHSLALTCVVPFPWTCLWARLRAAMRRRIPMNGRRVVPHLWRPRTVATPSRNAGRSR
jgi:hypothetical protein